MSTINRFQQYSQKENAITNNVLFMFSNLFDINPKYYEEYINGLIGENELYRVIPSFTQQVNNNGDGFIDGYVETKGSSIIIETKINGTEWIEKLLKYTKKFRPEERKFLFHLSTSEYDQEKIVEIKKRLPSNIGSHGIYFYSMTYENLVSQLKELSVRYPYDIQIRKLYDDFEGYCEKEKLLVNNTHIMRAMACGLSYDLNIKYKFYFDLSDRGYSPFKYFGVYKDKAVRYIGTIDNVIEADYTTGNNLIIHNSRNNKVTGEQQDRLIKAIKESMSLGWDVANNHKFFLFKEFCETNYPKASPGGIFRVRYFNLNDELGGKVPSKIEQLANELRGHQWS